MLTEDLALFFELEGFAVAAALKRPDGTLIRNAQVIFTDPSQEVALFAAGVEAGSPFIQAISTDVADLRDGYKVTIGSTTYRVSGQPHEDGTGVSTVQLKS